MPSKGNHDKQSGEHAAKPESRIRSVSGIDGLAARRVQTSSFFAVAPSTLDIRKARRAAIRAKTVNACDGCKVARYFKSLYPLLDFNIILEACDGVLFELMLPSRFLQQDTVLRCPPMPSLCQTRYRRRLQGRTEPIVHFFGGHISEGT